MNIVREHFDSIERMLTVINSRKNNEYMRDEDASQCTDEAYWYGTESYNEAIQLIKNGYTEPLEEIKRETANISLSSTTPRRIPKNSIVGYIPNVPNAIRGLPESMINIHIIPQKSKIIVINYNNDSNGMVQSEKFIKNGIVMLNILNKLELSGIRVKFNLVFCCSTDTTYGYNDFHFATVTLKDWREQLDLQKICFPICHSSMIRRFGFKWLETCKGLTRCPKKYGTARTASWVSNQPEIKKYIGENEFLLDMDDCAAGQEHIFKKLGIKLF